MIREVKTPTARSLPMAAAQLLSSGERPPHPITDRPAPAVRTNGPRHPRRNTMFHFTFIDEASTENEKEIVKKQETALKKAEKPSEENKDTLHETTNPMHHPPEKAKSIRLVINKN
jgi:hypothetical protein